MENEWKYQHSLKVGNDMFNFRTDNVQEMEYYIGAKELTLSQVKEALKNTSPEEVREPIPQYDPPKQESNGCSHKNTEEISGVSSFGPWSGLKCRDCGWKNFRVKGGNGFKGWVAPKIKR